MSSMRQCPGINCTTLIFKDLKLCGHCTRRFENFQENAGTGQIAKARRGTRSPAAGLSGLLQSPVAGSNLNTERTKHD